MGLSKLTLVFPAAALALVLTATNPYTVAQMSESKEAKITTSSGNPRQRSRG
jgi:hypothetical protein